VPASTSFVRAGHWIFGTGLSDEDPDHLFARLSDELAAAGSAMSLVARLDQYYPDARCVAPYQAARKLAFAGRQVAPSTSVIVGGLRDANAAIDVQVLAAASDSGYVLQEIGTGLNRPESSGYAPCLRAGDLIFVAGQLARDTTGALAVQGTARETEYILRRRLLPALEAAGSGPELVLKAQAYLSRPREVSEFNEIWKSFFASGVPPTTVVPVRHPAFLTAEATVEINVIAAHSSAAARVRRIESATKLRVLDGLIFAGGVAAPSMRQVLEQAEAMFRAADTSLSAVVRGLFFHSDLGEVGDPGFPFSAFRVEHGPLADLWGYTPGK
jgi:enamine deaminase RidA (YjgF/YER057c/UK114 family)